MRVVHLAATDIAGGAARSAYRLHRGLLQLGEDSSMLVRQKLSTDPTVQRLDVPPHPLAFYGALLQWVAIDRVRSEVSNTHFSLGWPGHDASAHPLVQGADVINLHWVAGFQFPGSLARLLGLGKKVVWTLHDMRPFTGGCHFSAGCARFATDCVQCPQLVTDPFCLPAAVLRDQESVLRGAGVTAVAPSQWLASCARRSRLFSGARIETIPYGIETERFAPLLRAEARRALGLKENGFLLLAGADHGAERRKGFHELSEALRFCATDAAFRKRIAEGAVSLACFGRPSDALRDLPLPVTPLGYIDSDEKLRAAYSAADLFILPSLEDNLPNTILESMSCGTPVAAFHVGGTPDLLEEGQTGFLTPAGDAAGLGRTILSALAQTGSLAAMRVACRERAERRYSLLLQARRYRQLYEDLRPTSVEHARAADVPDPAFQRAFAPLLLQGLEQFGLPPDPASEPEGHAQLRRRRRFSRHLAAVLKQGVDGRLPFPSLLVRMEALLGILRGANPWWIRLKCWRRDWRCGR